MKHIIPIILVLFITSLIGCNDSEYETRVINIISLEIHETGIVNNPIDIHIRARANNGCYSNLNVNLEQINQSNLQILATGKYDLEATVCPKVLVNLDTIISFIPTQAGTYYIIANQAPYLILRDTITVN